jgi:phosphoribosyl-ATP pyrophosphohydrolase/phosphoribosyl-AMP cyclohydrolase/histidinol dehydrogenase
MSSVSLRRVAPESIKSFNQFSLTDDVRATVTPIVNAVKAGGKAALIEYAVKFGDIPDASAKIVFSKADLKQAYDSIAPEEREVMERVAHRVRLFATAQRTSIKSVVSRVPGGYAMQDISAVECAGCYAPGGRYPLPSSVIMTAVTARVAGCAQVWVASPKPSAVILAAAYISDADGLIGVGGAQAIAALAYGVEGIVPQCNAVVGPGNKFVTAAKALVSGIVAIDMLAGPSECLVLADASANAQIVAADLLAQAEHDVDAVPILVTDSEEFARQVDAELNKQLSVLKTADVARLSVTNNGMAVVVSCIDQGVDICNLLAPEHLEVHVKETTGSSSALWGQSLLSERFTNYGCLFIGSGSAEVIGDYGAGPNHTLPTSGAARSFGGLSVFSFLRIRTRLTIDNEHKASIL